MSRLYRAARAPLRSLEFAVKDNTHADFAADVKTVVRDAGGHAVIQIDSAGPFVLAKLPPGRYSVDASPGNRTRTLHRTIVVKRDQPAKAVFVWPDDSPSA